MHWQETHPGYAAARASCPVVTAAIVIVQRAFGTAPTVLPSTPSDSWCCPAEPVDVPKSRVG